MFGNSQWKSDVTQVLNELRQKVSDLERGQNELRMQNQKLSVSLRSVARKLVMKLPLSLESLDKGLMYDLIFPEEIEAWASMAHDGLVIDLRSAEEFRKDSIPGSYNLPFESLAQKMDKFSKYQPVLFVCDNGIKSVSACELFATKGFAFLYVLKGGMSHYEGRKVPGMPIQNTSEVEARA